MTALRKDRDVSLAGGEGGGNLVVRFLAGRGWMDGLNEGAIVRPVRRMGECALGKFWLT